jgi:ribosomal protein S19
MEKITEIKKIRAIDCGKEFLIYNGKSFIRLPVVREMVGLSFQDFVLTKKVGRYIHDKSKKGKEAKKKKK